MAPPAAVPEVSPAGPATSDTADTVPEPPAEPLETEPDSVVVLAESVLSALGQR
jgi:hypothetical protein